MRNCKVLTGAVISLGEEPECVKTSKLTATEFCECVLCAIKPELTYNDTVVAFKVNDVFKEWFYPCHTHISHELS